MHPQLRVYMSAHICLRAAMSTHFRLLTATEALTTSLSVVPCLFHLPSVCKCITCWGCLFFFSLSITHISGALRIPEISLLQHALSLSLELKRKLAQTESLSLFFALSLPPAKEEMRCALQQSFCPSHLLLPASLSHASSFPVSQVLVMVCYFFWLRSFLSLLVAIICT